MVEYTRKLDWQLNNNVKVELVKRYVDTNQVKIATTKGNVEIKGKLGFTGKQYQDMEVQAIMNLMKQLDLAIKGLPYVRDVKWDLDAWKKVGARWQFIPPGGGKARKKEDERRPTQQPAQESGSFGGSTGS